MCGIDKDKRGRLVEWVEKTSFTQLNKLFKIDMSEWNHKVMLSNKNLMALINETKFFIIPILPHVASLSLVPNKHFMLKYLPFYEVTHLADSEARQARLKEREKKSQEGTLRQTPTTSHLASSSTTHHLAKKKKMTYYPTYSGSKDSATHSFIFSIYIILFLIFIFFNYQQ